MLKKIVVNLAYLAVMLVLGFVIYYLLLNPLDKMNDVATDHSKRSTAPFFSANLPNEHGVNQALNQYKGKVIVVNFWATWCPPCREEMPELSALHTEYQAKNVVVLGVAIDEMGLVKSFNKTTPVSYPLIVAEEEGMALANQLGNDKGVLPYTVIIDANGTIVKTFFGRINKSLIVSALQPLILK